MSDETDTKRACWDRTEGCWRMRPKRAWGEAPGLIRMSRFGDGWIVACCLCPKSSTGAPRNFAWPKGDLVEAIKVLSNHFGAEHPLHFGYAPIDADDWETCEQHGTLRPCRHCAYDAAWMTSERSAP